MIVASKGVRVSPRQFTVMVAGEGRNAWRDLWVRLHGENNWVSAAMQTTLSLVEHVHYKATRQLERRLPKSRRMEDVLDD